MSSEARPPVNEVVVSISFERQAVLEGPRFLIGLSDVLAAFPQVTEVPPYEMPEEQPFEDQILRPAVPQIKLVGPSQLVPHRYWLTAEEPGALLLQVQADYFALNWRRESEVANDYPGHESLLQAFAENLTRFQRGVFKLGGSELQINRLELTYINILKPDGLWGDIGDLRKVIALDVAGLDDVEQLNFTYSRPITVANGAFYGRLHVAVATGYQPKVEPIEPGPLRAAEVIPVINLSLTARTARIDSNAADIEPRFTPAHEAVTDAFRGLATQAALNSWSLG